MDMKEWAIGVVLNLGGSVVINLGTNLMKLSHNKRAQAEAKEQVRARRSETTHVAADVAAVCRVLNLHVTMRTSEILCRAWHALPAACPHARQGPSILHMIMPHAGCGVVFTWNPFVSHTTTMTQFMSKH